MDNFSEEKKKGDTLPVFFWIFLVATLSVLLILTVTLLDRNGTIDGWKAQYKQWKEEREAERRIAEAGEKTVHYFGPSGIAEYESWISGEWKAALEQGESSEQTEGNPGGSEGAEGNRKEITDPLRLALEKSPVNGTETWWSEVKRITGDVTLYAQAGTPLYHAPEKTATVCGYGEAGEEFRLFGVFKYNWYVVTDGMYYYCTEGNRYTLVKPEEIAFEEVLGTVEKKKVFHEVETVLQNPELPHGCEVAGLAMLLSYYGVDADKCELADVWLPKGVWGETDFRKAFVGDPRKTYASAGCYATVIAETANRYLQERGKDGNREAAVALTAVAEEAVSFETLLAMVEQAPVLVWTTMNLQAPYIAQVWEVDGEELYWLNCEHCVVLTGYDAEKGIFYGTDPLYGPCEYDMKLFSLRFSTMYSQVVSIEGDTP